jgi:hypothetical protein
MIVEINQAIESMWRNALRPLYSDRQFDRKKMCAILEAILHELTKPLPDRTDQWHFQHGTRYPWPGVYALMPYPDAVGYIGQSKNVERRLVQHMRRGCDFDRARAVYVEAKEHRLWLEARLTRGFREQLDAWKDYVNFPWRGF